MKELILCKLRLDGAFVVTEPSTLPQSVLPYLKTIITLSACTISFSILYVGLSATG